MVGLVVDAIAVGYQTKEVYTSPERSSSCGVEMVETWVI